MTNNEKGLNAALENHRKGNLFEAEKTYREILRHDPAQPDANHLLGLIELQRGTPEMAIYSIQQAIAVNPNSAEFHNSLAAAFRAKGMIQTAISAYRKSLELDPNNAAVHNNLGNALRECGRIDEANENFDEAIKLSPHFAFSGHNSDSSSEAASQSKKVLRPTNIGAQAELGEPIEITVKKKTEKTKTVLHVGCGAYHPDLLHENFRGEQWKEVRLDIDPDVKPDIVASITEMSVVEDETYDALWSSHNLEHLYPHDVPLALAEFYRVLKNDGMILVTMPDLQQVAQYIVEDKLDDVAYVSPMGPITPLDCLFGLSSEVENGNEYMSHKTGFTAKSLAMRMEKAGFQDLKIWTTSFALWGEAYKRNSSSA